nr:hypothetical protein [Mycolicibacterium bacteremicum]
MCHAVPCEVCEKTTWKGCGHHVADVMRSVPPAQRCQCGKRTASPRTIAPMWRRNAGRGLPWRPH